MKTNKIEGKKDYQNLLFMHILKSYDRYHPTDLFSYTLAFIRTLDDDKEEEKELKDKYMAVMKDYFRSLKLGLEGFFELMGGKNDCPEYCDTGIMFLITLVRYTPNEEFRNPDTGLSISRYSIEHYFKMMGTHLLLIVSEIGKKLNLELEEGFDTSYIPPQPDTK